jgi:hypothetical protein
MSLFTPARINKNYEVHNSDYILTENNPNEGTPKPAEPLNPQQPESE